MGYGYSIQNCVCLSILIAIRFLRQKVVSRPSIRKGTFPGSPQTKTRTSPQELQARPVGRRKLDGPHDVPLRNTASWPEHSREEIDPRSLVLMARRGPERRKIIKKEKDEHTLSR